MQFKNGLIFEFSTSDICNLSYGNPYSLVVSKEDILKK